MQRETRWDIVEEIGTRTKNPRSLKGAIASSSMMTVVLSMIAIGGTAFPTASPVSRSQSVLEVIRVERKDVRRSHRPRSESSDTQLGMSTSRLAALFPVLFEPADEDGGGEPFFMQ